MVHSGAFLIVSSLSALIFCDVSPSALGIASHIPWITRWLDGFVDLTGLGLASVNIGNIIVDRRIQSGSTSRDPCSIS